MRALLAITAWLALASPASAITLFTMTELPWPSGPSAELTLGGLTSAHFPGAWAVNENGDHAGGSLTGQGYRSIGGVVSALPADTFAVRDINIHGQVLASTFYGMNVIYGPDGSVTTLLNEEGTADYTGYVSRINDLGQLMGQTMRVDPNPDAPGGYEYVWLSGAAILHGLNDEGVSSGASHDGAAQWLTPSIWLADNTRIDLPFDTLSWCAPETGGCVGGEAYGALDANRVVGTTTISTDMLGVATYWENGIAYSLEDYTVNLPGDLLFSTALALNAKGQIRVLGYGYDGMFRGEYLLSPVSAVPEPSSWALMIGGFGLAGWSLRRSRGGMASRAA